MDLGNLESLLFGPAKLVGMCEIEGKIWLIGHFTRFEGAERSIKAVKDEERERQSRKGLEDEEQEEGSELRQLRKSLEDEERYRRLGLRQL
jgi:hypothetical protein